jgi:hypothetical protein
MRLKAGYTFLPVLLLLIFLIRCKQAYEPPAIKAANNYLVVDGFINTGANAVTAFNVNRTRNLGDSTAVGTPELNAHVTIVGTGGASYTLIDSANVGIYTSTPLNLDLNQQYSIAITTSDNRVYKSDAVPCKQTPAIDSVYWQEPNDLNIYVATHDPTNNARYYRYSYLETWEHDAELSTVWTVENGMIVATDSTNQKQQCWTTQASTNVLITTSSALTQDIISGFLVTDIPNGDPKVNIRYSTLVSQYALTEDAYNYWLLFQKTSQGLGTLFDLQPTQLVGNIHCVTNPSEPVIGFISASSVQQQRIFIRESSLTNWGHNQAVYGCDSIEIAVNPVNPFIYNYPDTFYAPWYFITGGPLVLGSRFCLDCTLFGGTNMKPPFW